MDSNVIVVDAFLIAFNEEKILPFVLQHYSTFCRHIYLYDNESTDRTAEIALTFPKVKLRSFSTGGQFDDAAHLEIKNNCWKESKADFVIVADCDELLYASHIVSDLNFFKRNDVTMPIIEGYNMYSEIFPDKYPMPIIQQVRNGIKDRTFNKQIIFNPFEIKEINYAAGCHTCKPVGNITTHRHALKLLHYKYLSEQYVLDKHLAYAQRLSKNNLHNGWGREYLYAREHVPTIFKTLSKASTKVI